MKDLKQYIKDKIEQQKILLKTNELTHEHNSENGVYEDNPEAKAWAENNIFNQRTWVKLLETLPH